MTCWKDEVRKRISCFHCERAWQLVEAVFGVYIRVCTLQCALQVVCHSVIFYIINFIFDNSSHFTLYVFYKM